MKVKSPIEKRRPNFLLNKSGIPLSYEGWIKLWKFYDCEYEILKTGEVWTKPETTVWLSVKLYT